MAATDIRLTPGASAPDPIVSVEGRELRLGEYRDGHALVLTFLRHLM